MKRTIETTLTLCCAFPPNILWVLPTMLIWKGIENRKSKRPNNGTSIERPTNGIV